MVMHGRARTVAVKPFEEVWTRCYLCQLKCMIFSYTSIFHISGNKTLYGGMHSRFFWWFNKPLINQQTLYDFRYITDEVKCNALNIRFPVFFGNLFFQKIPFRDLPMEVQGNYLNFKYDVHVDNYGLFIVKAIKITDRQAKTFCLSYHTLNEPLKRTGILTSRSVTFSQTSNFL